MKQIKKGTRVRVKTNDQLGVYVSLSGMSNQFHHIELDNGAHMCYFDEDIEVITELKKGMPVIAEDEIDERVEGFFHSDDKGLLYPIIIVYDRNKCFDPFKSLKTSDYEVFDPEDVKPKFNPGDIVYSNYQYYHIYIRQRYQYYDDQNGSLCHCIGSNMFNTWVSDNQILTEAEYNLKNQQEDRVFRQSQPIDVKVMLPDPVPGKVVNIQNDSKLPMIVTAGPGWNAKYYAGSDPAIEDAQLIGCTVLTQRNDSWIDELLEEKRNSMRNINDMIYTAYMSGMFPVSPVLKTKYKIDVMRAETGKKKGEVYCSQPYPAENIIKRVEGATILKTIEFEL